MKIKELKQLVDKAYKNSNKGEASIEIVLKLEDDYITCKIDSIGQYHVIPDMTIGIKIEGEKIYSSKKLTPKQLDYKRKYEELEKRLIEIKKIIEV